jgi:hypothetical protein
MPVYTRVIAFPVELTAADDLSADRDAMDHAIAAVQYIETRDVTGSLTVGKLTVTGPAAARADYLVAYGSGPLALAKVDEWRSAGLEVESRDVGGLIVHRPVNPAACGRAAGLAQIDARAADPNNVLWTVDLKGGAA